MTDLGMTDLGTIDLGPAATTMQHVADGIDDDALGAPTPCEVEVAQVLAHVLGLCVAFREAARKIRSEVTGTPPGLSAGELPTDWRQQLPVLLADLVAAWREPAAWAGTTHIAGMDLAAVQVGLVANNELVLHAWDLAVASGERYDPHPGALEAAWQVVSATPDDPEVRAGMFGAAVAVPPDAPLLARVLGGSGRDPGWSAPA